MPSLQSGDLFVPVPQVPEALRLLALLLTMRDRNSMTMPEAARPTTTSITQAVNRLAWQVGELPEEDFRPVWTALGVVTRAVCTKKGPAPVAKEPALLWL